MSDSDVASSDTASHQGLVQISGLPKEIYSIKDVKHWYFSAFLLHAPVLSARAVISYFASWVHHNGNQVSDSDRAGSDRASYQGLVQISGIPNEICSVIDAKH